MKEKYESLSLATLKDLAKARGLKGISTMRKPELIERMLEEDKKEQTAENEQTISGTAEENTIPARPEPVAAEKTENKINFTHLHVHTEYSLLDGSNKIKEYVDRVKELGMDSAAITDHGVMYGVIDFYRAARAAGINPILGCEVYVAPGSRFDREAGSGEDRYYHLVLLAENNQGYSNLMKIVSKGFVEGFYYKPRVDLQLLEK